MGKGTYLFYTNNYYLSKQEIILRNGKILRKITDKMFFAVLPNVVPINSLRHCSTSKPQNLDLISQLAADAWKDWNQINLLT